MNLPFRSAAFAIACMFMAPSVASADGIADTYMVFDPGAPIIYMDFASMYYGTDAAGSAGIPKQSPEQVEKNLQRLATRPSEAARQMALANRTEFMEYETEQLQNIAKELFSDDTKRAVHRTDLIDHGFDPDNLADTITAYALSTYSLAHSGSSGWSGISDAQMAAARQSVRKTLADILPPELTSDMIRSVIEETEAEHIFQHHLMEIAVSEGEADSAIVKQWLIDRAEDFAMMDVHATELSDKDGFIAR